VDKALEIGHIFKLGYKYSESMGLKVLDSNGREVPVIMGSYGIGIERILAAAVELFHDELGICWPRSISPFDIVITVVNPGDEAQSQAGKNLYRELTKRTLGCLLDDREERVGVKFKDAELIGIPIRVTVGKKLAKGEIEVFSRVERSYETIPIDSSADRISSMLEAYPL
jgi:prolyl-tRNA synthetase